MREERIVVAGHELRLMRPEDPESLIDDKLFDEDEFLPYWAELWPSGLALARHLAARDLRGRSVLELGCGIAVPSFAAALAGAEVTATDWAAEAIALVVENAAANEIALTATVLDWRSGGAPGGARFDLVVAADVLYEERNAEPLLALLRGTVAPEGEALIADPGRRHSAAFFERVRATGWATELIAATEVPAGGITVLRRATLASG